MGSSPILAMISQRKPSDSSILCYEKFFGRAKNLHSFILKFTCILVKKNGSKIYHKRRRLKMCVEGFRNSILPPI